MSDQKRPAPYSWRIHAATFIFFKGLFLQEITKSFQYSELDKTLLHEAKSGIQADIIKRLPAAASSPSNMGYFLSNDYPVNTWLYSKKRIGVYPAI